MKDEGGKNMGQIDSSKIFKYSTGCGQEWEDIDPEIAADLSIFLE